MLKEELRKDPKINVSAVVEKAIREKAFSLAVDNLLIARSLQESHSIEKLDEWEGQIVEDSYKILRDNLIECAYMIMHEGEVVEESATAGALIGLTLGLLTPLPIITGVAVGAGLGAAYTIWRQRNTERIKKFCRSKFPKDPAKKAECISAGGKAMNIKVAQAKAKAKAKS